MTVFHQHPQLLLAFRRGERSALETVYKTYVDEVIKLLRFGFVTGADAKVLVPGLHDGASLLDTVQEVFLRAFQERARLSYDATRPYRPFLLRIARNLRVDQLRGQNRERPLSSLAPHDDREIDVDVLIESNQPIPEDVTPQAQREWSVLTERTRNYVASLDDESRRFVELRFVNEQSQSDVAAQLGVTRRHVRTLEERVLTGLRRLLARS